MFRIIYNNEKPAGYAYDKAGEYTEEQAETIVKYGVENPSNDTIDQVTNSDNLLALRAHRDRLLAQTDYWIFSDTSKASEAQLEYRQALRDITDQYTSLDTVVWPVKPE
jgi:hypothetical protein